VGQAHDLIDVISGTAFAEYLLVYQYVHQIGTCLGSKATQGVTPGACLADKHQTEQP
jgi:hypothetical protein